MNHKQNAIEIIRFGHPERIVSSPPSHGIAYRGCNHEGYEGGGHHLPVGSTWTDVWGTVWKKIQEGVMGFPISHPLVDFPDALKAYHWPDPQDERICSWIYEQAGKQVDSDATMLMGSHRETLWEKSYMLAGMENIMCAFRAEPNAVKDLLHRIMDWQIAMAGHYLEAGIEIASLGDDLGTQSGRLFSGEILEEFFVPEYRRLFDLYRKHGVIISFHSCGHIMPILDTFMSLGVDILNPIQATANDLDELRRRTQGRMALQGGVSSGVIVSGPTERIREEVRRRIRQLGANGGYFCKADQGMPWPEEHHKAMQEAIEEFGKYPIDRSQVAGQPRHTGVGQ